MNYGIYRKLGLRCEYLYLYITKQTRPRLDVLIKDLKLSLTTGYQSVFSQFLKRGQPANMDRQANLTPTRPLEPPSPSWSPISPLRDTPGPSLPNSSLLADIMMTSGIYSPRRDALAPTKTPEGGITNKDDNNVKRAPRKLAGMKIKKDHLAWTE